MHLQGLVRKRLVPFLLAENASIRSTANSGPMEPLNADLMKKIIDIDYPQSCLKLPESVVSVGSSVYVDAVTTKSIGEVIHLDSTGTIGVAMIQQAVLQEESLVKSNFVVRAPIAKTGSVDPSDASAESDAPASKTINLDAPVSYISTFRPTWFQGLDERTGNVADL